MVTVTVSTAAKTATLAPPLRVLLVGDQEEDFFLIREILERNRATLEADLEHARTIDDARSMLGKKPYDLILFEHASGDAEAVGLISELLRGGISVPFILLTADADEKPWRNSFGLETGIAWLSRASTRRPF